jgi:predicted dehydrogenase
MGKFHIHNLSSIGIADFTAICDKDEDAVKALSAQYGVKGFTDYRKFLSVVDAVVVVVPTFLHYRFASEALEAGKHVLLEKPMTKTVYFAEKLIEMAAKKEVVLQVGHVERFNPAVQELHNIVKDPYLIQVQRLGPKSRIRDVGVVLDLMIHDIDIVMSVANSEVADVSAYGKRIYSGFEDVATANLYFRNGAVANITSSRVTENKLRTLAVSQEGSYVSLDFATQEITIVRQPQSNSIVQKEEIKYKQESLVEKVMVHKDNALLLEQKHFIECIQNKRTPIHTPQENLEAMKIAKQITEKIYTGWHLL